MARKEIIICDVCGRRIQKAPFNYKIMDKEYEIHQRCRGKFKEFIFKEVLNWTNTQTTTHPIP